MQVQLLPNTAYTFQVRSIGYDGRETSFTNKVWTDKNWYDYKYDNKNRLIKMYLPVGSYATESRVVLFEYDNNGNQIWKRTMNEDFAP
ncbi:hypothetical protein D3C73_1409510 [compost metagenome]